MLQLVDVVELSRSQDRAAEDGYSGKVVICNFTCMTCAQKLILVGLAVKCPL